MEPEMSKKKKDSGPAHSGPVEAAYAMPVRLPYGFASLVFAGGRLVAVPWEKDRRLLLASIRTVYPGARQSGGAVVERCREILARYANADFPTPGEILRLPYAWDRVSPFDRAILET